MRIDKGEEYRAKALAEVCSSQLNIENQIAGTRLNALFADLHELLSKKSLREHEGYQLSSSLKQLASESMVSVSNAIQIADFYTYADKSSKYKISRNLLSFGATLVGPESTSRLKELGFKL